MATTTHGGNHETATTPHPEPESDKLGPLGHGNSVLTESGTLRSALLDEFMAATNAARAAAAEVDDRGLPAAVSGAEGSRGSIDAGAATAVHEYRKALRRARAVLSMIGDALPKSERRAVRTAIRDARRAVSTARDQTVAPDALAQLALGEAERTTANAVLANAAQAMSPLAEIKQLLADGAARAAAQAEALQAALPQTIEWRDVVDSVAGIYGDARRSRRRARKSSGAFHVWRRRSKELGYQLEWIAGHAGGRTAALVADYDAATTTLGAAVDLIMLREFVATHAQGIAPEAIAHLTTAIDAQLGAHLKTGRKAGKPAFAYSAKQFARRLTRAVRKDLRPSPPTAPADDAEPDASSNRSDTDHPAS